MEFESHRLDGPRLYGWRDWEEMYEKDLSLGEEEYKGGTVVKDCVEEFFRAVPDRLHLRRG